MIGLPPVLAAGSKELISRVVPQVLKVLNILAYAVIYIDNI